MFQLEKTYQGWSMERLTRHIIYWTAWLLLFAITNSTYNDGSFLNWVKVELLVMCIKLPFAYFVMYYLVPNYLFPKKYLRFFLSFLILAFIGGFAIWSCFLMIINPWILSACGNFFWSGKIIYKMIDLMYIASAPVVLKMYQRQSLQEKRATQLVEQKLGAELTILKNQLHPHFLFNTLNNLYSMVLTNHPKASDVVVRLSDMMSYMLYDCERNLIDLNKEIGNLKNYIELEKLRYGKRLDISFETGGDVATKSIAPLLLLPFLENAFKHGVEKNEQSSWVRINLWIEKNTLTYLVENNIPENGPDDVPKMQSGIGLANVKKRLELLYPNDHQLEIIENETFLIKLNLNLNNEMPNH